MKQKAKFYEKQNEYKYFPLGDGRADVFIRNFLEEEKEIDENGNEIVLFVYEQNEFRVNMEEITEDMIKENPMNYLNYSNEITNVSLEERISALEGALVEMSEVIF